MAAEKKKAYFANRLNGASKNPKKLFSLVDKELDRNQKKCLPESIGSIEDVANSFNEFFTQKIAKIRNEIKTTDVIKNIECIFQGNFLEEFAPATLEEVKEILGETGVKASPDDILPQSLLKDHINDLLPVIVKLINLSLSSGNLDGVKLADIIPTLKDLILDVNGLKNYRPVSNLQFIGKIIERMVLERLNTHMSKYNLHCPQQSAYKKGNSTETLLIKITNDILRATDERCATVVMLLDLSAAFDTVDHDLLLKILENEIGLKGKVLLWFESFLKGRSQRIRIGKVTSGVIYIKFGVPQGSVLGPVLFNIYIRSIYSCVNRLGFDISGYADDHQILKVFRPNNQYDILVNQLDNCFTTTKAWMSNYFLMMNDPKTQIIVFGTTKVLKEVTIRGINLTSGSNIRFISTIKNLGIVMDDHLTFYKQVVLLKKKSFNMIRKLYKVRHLLSEHDLKLVVNALVVSCLDYCNGIFYGIADNLIAQLQLILNAAAKVVKGKLKYDHMGNDLNDLHWLPIKRDYI